MSGGPAERLLGAEIPQRVRPLLAMTLAAVVGQWMLTAYLPIYVVTRLSFGPQNAGLLLATATATGVVVGPVGGRVADRMGRVPVLVTSLVLQAISAVLLLVVPGRGSAAAAAVVLAVGFTLRTTVQNTLAADLSDVDDREGAFALLRTAVNLSAAAGPAAGAGLLLLGWPWLWAGSLLASVVAVPLAYRLPATSNGHANSTANSTAPVTSQTPGDDSARAPGDMSPQQSSRVGAGVSLGVAGNTLAWTVYNAFEVLLPVVIAGTYHLSPSLWGLLFLLNPIGVVLLQVRLVAATARFGRSSRLLLATGLMSTSFLLLLVSHHLAVLGLVVVAFTVGEILWGPTSQALIVCLAPPGRRGMVMGLLSSSATAGAVLASAVGLPLLAHAGPGLTWTAVAATGLISGQLFRATAHVAARRDRKNPSGRIRRVGIRRRRPSDCSRARTSSRLQTACGSGDCVSVIGECSKITFNLPVPPQC